MARDIGMAPDAELWRAVITKSYGDGTVHTVYEGPYDKPGPARSRVTFWRNHLAKRDDGSKADGHVERCQPVWEKVPDPAQRPTPQADTSAVAETAAADPAVQLVLDAMRERRGMHGRHAADLLAEHGYTAEAELVREEVRAQNGHLSAKQAVQLLQHRTGSR
jgi:hypothetical protein